MEAAPSSRDSGDRPAARVLWVTDEPLDRSRGGGSIRQAHLFEALASALPTDLLAVGSDPDQRARELAAQVTVLPRGASRGAGGPVRRRALSLAVTLGSRYPSAMYPQRPVRRALAAELAQRRGRYAVVCLEHEGLAPLIPSARAERWILTFHYLLSGMIERELALAPGRRQRWFRARDLRRARALESAALRSYDRCIVCSDEDAAALAAVGGDGRPGQVAVIPNGVDLKDFSTTPVPAAPGVLFPGRLDWPPNVDGARWFCTEVWPRVKAEVATAELSLVGRAPVPEVLELGELPGVTVHADVPLMAPYFESARIVLVPLRVGTGTRLKALEGLAAGRPVVGTTVGLEGIGIVDGAQALVADEPAAFADAVIRALRDDALAGALARAGRAHVEGAFGWEQIGERFVSLVSALL